MAFLDSIPSFVVIAFAGIGALCFANKFISYAILLLDLFGRKGTNVRSS
jgi:hypothetical protein